jgi:pimeloyl-ACP methyl ester carboxylesterase
MRVFLIHGMGRTRISMMLLGRRLARAGFQPSSFGYLVTREPLDGIAARFVEHVRSVVKEGEPFGVVGHSLGNIITRFASDRLPPEFSRFVMLAPPNHPPAIARAFSRNPVFKALTQDAGRRLTDPEFYAKLPVPRVPSLIFAGTSGPSARWLPFRGAPSDGVVAVEETRLPGVPVVEVPCLHTFIMNDRSVTERMAHFLQTGALAATAEQAGQAVR